MKRITTDKIFGVLFYIIFFGLIYMFLSYKLIEVPPGINIDESSIGYNASLISESLQDENNRFLPVFILTLDGKDWKNPVNIYSTVILFKILGKSYFVLRLVSVLYALISGFLFFKLLNLFFTEKLSFIGLVLFFLSPSILIQSHLASDNISPLPFFILWLYFFFSHIKKPVNWKIVFSGIFLGLSFYSYKGMRAMVPVYFALSASYLFYYHFLKEKKIKPLLLFLAGILPFILPIKWLQVYYAGAIFDPKVISRPSFFDAIYTYLSSFDFSFLFVKGDLMLIHSTGRHGMFLVPTLVLFFLGLFQIVEERKPSFYFILGTLIFTPLLLTLVGSVYRASRLMTYIPLATFIFTLGVKRILSTRQELLRNTAILFFAICIPLSYFNFVQYYWNEYPKTVSQHFSPNFNLAMKELRDLSQKDKKVAYLEKSVFSLHRADVQFFWEVYFPYEDLKIWTRKAEPFPQNSLVLTSISGSGDILTLKEVPSLKPGQKTLYIVGK